MIAEEFESKTVEFEETLQKIAGDVAGGVIFDKLEPSEMLKRTEVATNRLVDLAGTISDLMLILKPEKAYSIRAKKTELVRTLKTFQGILVQNSLDPSSNSRMAFEQLKNAIAASSDFLVLMHEIKEHPSPLINAIVAHRKAVDSKSALISIQTSEEIQPLVKHVFNGMDELRTALTGLERRVDEMKRMMRELQEESIKVLSEKQSTGEDFKGREEIVEKKQLSLSNFKNEQN